MQQIRKRPRSPSSSSDELPLNTHPFSRDRTLSPLPHAQTDSNELDLDPLDPLTNGPARKRRKGLQRGLERMGLDDEMGSNSGWRLPALSESSGLRQEPTIISPSGNEMNRSGFGRENEWPAVVEQGKGVLGADELSRVVYPAQFEVPEEEEDRSPELEPPYSSMREHEDEMMLDPTDSQSTLPDHTRARPKGRNWYEPEPDRIIVTSLSDSDGESTYTNSPSKPWARAARGAKDGVIDLDNDAEGGIIDLTQYRAGSEASSSSSFEDYLSPEAAKGIYSQPGSKGFLISPSLLSRLSQLSDKERKQWSQRMGVSGQLRPTPVEGGRELVLYRQVPERAGAIEWPSTAGGGMDMRTDMGMEESGRFEEIGDEMGGMELELDGRSLNRSGGEVGMGMDMDDGMDIG